MREGIIKDTYKLIIKEIQTILTVSYIIIVGIGMLFKFQKYSEFQINIFQYADIFDFLIAPFSDIYILLFATASIVFVITLFWLSALWKNRSPKWYSRVNLGFDKKSWFKFYRAIIGIISTTLYLYMSANYYAKYERKTIVNENDISLRFEDNEMISGKFIGKTKDVFFLLNRDNVYAIPVTSLIKDIKIR